MVMVRRVCKPIIFRSITNLMANPEHLNILKQGVSKWNDWRKKHEEIFPNLEGAALFQANLEKAILSEVNLSGADLNGASLEKVNISKAYLSNANLSHANLREANLNRSTLNGAFLSGADLRGASLSGTYLRGAFLTGVDFSGADLTGADLTDADLTGANLNEANLSATNFSGVVLSEPQEELIDQFRSLEPESSAILSQAIVSINLPQKKIGLLEKESILNAVVELMSELGFVFKGDEEPIHGSFFQRLIYVFKNPKNKREVKEIYQKGKQALEEQLLNKPSSESTENLASAAASLLSAMDKVDEGVVRLGRIIVVKLIQNEKTKVAIQTVSPTIAAELDSDPSLEKNPITIFNLLLEKTTNPVIQETTIREINE